MESLGYLLLLVTQGGVGGLFFYVTCDIGGVGGGSPMLPLLVTWVPGTNVTRYNRYPTSSCLLRVTVLQYKSKILACYKAQIAHFGGEFSKKCYKVPVKSVTRGGYTQLLLLHLLLRGGRGVPRVTVTKHYKVGGAKKLVLQSVT